MESPSTKSEQRRRQKDEHRSRDKDSDEGGVVTEVGTDWAKHIPIQHT